MESIFKAQKEMNKNIVYESFELINHDIPF